MCERLNRTLLDMQNTSPIPEVKLEEVPFPKANNSTRHESTGLSPHFLMFGRDPILPVNVAFGINKTSSQKSLSILRISDQE